MYGIARILHLPIKRADRKTRKHKSNHELNAACPIADEFLSKH